MNNKKNAKPEAKEPEILKDELTGQMQRLQAEFENYKKRVSKEQEQYKDHIRSKLLLKFLEIADNFERALTTKDTNGIELIAKQVQKLLQEEQVTEIKSKGEKLDTNKHEVLAQEKGEQDDIITEELQKGYMLKDRVLRPARVKISRRE